MLTLVHKLLTAPIQAIKPLFSSFPRRKMALTALLLSCCFASHAIHPLPEKPRALAGQRISNRALAGFLGANPDRVFDRSDEHLSVPDLAGLRRLHDRLDRAGDPAVRQDHFDF